ncbi:16S rRNA (adenine(1518)-N(6)/adenine(1519)-N(6))-dimethyltransferase RsmA [Sediminitomix flava]|uniref:Ribosomal RNA small subunit methyltransferase A n=1 Tax=Sediminitomix flava TaxID=379075 RepID=A0A315ZD26_SEDFL|nr:16S rRNA (adenine(1518)-N(6)/adenine(1519)-N(6))-dimethyltransferase RsmA [Sediminitomix flava]PWJ42748.1 dimethyladenosine transferase [Sediminitomix flava]
MGAVKPKKHLGQHFLEDMQIADRIVESMSLHGGYKEVLEIGPGMGVLTERLIKRSDIHTKVVEIDKESVVYLHEVLKLDKEQIISGDFLKLRLDEIAPNPLGIIGNFPYNISSQIFFKVLDYKDQITEVVGMIQKEVAERIASPAGKKTNGILTILLGAYYDIEYLFTVPPEVFNPPPKVDSAVIALRRNDRKELEVNPKLFKQIVKMGFNNRRKTLRNCLKSILPTEWMAEHEVFTKRAEQLDVDGFIELTRMIEEYKKENNIQ